MTRLITMTDTAKPAPGSPAWQIQTLTASAIRLARDGDLAGAERIYEQILEAAPYNVRALNALATRAAQRGDLNRAQVLLERAVQSAPTHPIAHENLGHLLSAKGEKELALACFRKASDLKPDFVFSWIYQANILEELGRLEEAIPLYAKVASMAPPEAVVATDPRIRDDKRPIVLRALQRFRAILCDELLGSIGELRDQFGDAAMQRIIDCVKIKSGATAPRYLHALQKPEWLYIPDLEPRAFFERDQFAWAPELEAQTDSIRNELATLLESEANVVPYVQISGDGDKHQWTTLNYSSAWSAYHLLKDASPVADHCEKCPATSAATGNVPMVRIERHAPEVFFSILKPGTHIPPHHGLGNYKLAVHLPLMVPESCGIRVGHETHEWREGQCLIFDDSFQHEAWNRSEQLRAVLILEVWNPGLSEPERAGIRHVMAAWHNFNQKYQQ
ncbi:MAG TPA: aspartyl/asparaginyl beta-hydroxylase domain-containing protein [Gammaproteobacteria bacterium]|nr:aspartyl/asparaginyl beta-hydroxylase domain-containing protein [Gammaproteobacteria bacterium]